MIDVLGLSLINGPCFRENNIIGFGTLFLKACKILREHPPSQLRFYISIISSNENVQVIDCDHPYFYILIFLGLTFFKMTELFFEDAIDDTKERRKKKL